MASGHVIRERRVLRECGLGVVLAAAVAAGPPRPAGADPTGAAGSAGYSTLVAAERARACPPLDARDAVTIGNPRPGARGRARLLLPAPPSHVATGPGVTVVAAGGGVLAFDPDGALLGRARTGRVVDLMLDGAKDIYLVTASGATGRGDRVVHLTIESVPPAAHPDTCGRLRWRFGHTLPRAGLWRVRLADVDGDGRRELALGAHKRARFDPQPRNRLFLYEWPGHTLYPKWLGSRLALPFEDFRFADCDGDGRDELYALEVGPQGRRRVMTYRWRGFGFAGAGFVEVSPAARAFDPGPGGPRILGRAVVSCDVGGQP